jgi:hypothetical protein
MSAEDFKIDPIRHPSRIVRPADPARRGRDQRPHGDDHPAGGEHPARDAEGDAESESRRPHPGPAPAGGEPGIDILARGRERGRNLTAAATENAPETWRA